MTTSGEQIGAVRRRWVYGSWIAVLAGHVLLLAHLLRHRSLYPSVLGRYTVEFAVLLGGVLLSFVAVLVFVVTRWRRLPACGASLARLYERAPGLLAALLAAGAVLAAGAIVFRSLIALFVPALPVAVGLSTMYGGALGVVLSPLTRGQAARLGQHMVLVLGGLVVGLALAEAGLRLFPPFDAYRVLPPDMRWEFRAAPGLMPGITGTSAYTTNEDGIRGDPYRPSGRYNILAVGGSTTECAYLDDAEAWPHLLQERLNRPGRQPPAWVGNVGRSGHGLVEHIHVLRYFVPQFRIDAVIVMAGANDLLPALWEPEQDPARAEDPDAFQRFFYHSFYEHPLVDARLARPFPENLAVWSLIEQGFWRFYRPMLTDLRVEDLAGLNYEARRRLRRHAPEAIADLPDLSAALDQYEHNLRTLIDAARSQDVRLILATQPVLWSDHLSPEAERLLWFGLKRPAGRYRYTVQVLVDAMDRFNTRLLEVCRATGTECVDLAALLNGDERAFYDDVHFNEYGARVVAARLAGYLMPADVSGSSQR